MTQKSEEFRTLVQAIEVLDQHLNKTRERDKVKDQFIAAERAVALIADFKRQLADIYRSPEQAFAMFAAISVAEGVEEAIARFNEDPDKAGELKGWAIGPLNNSARAAILKLSLPIALKTGSAGFTNHLLAGGGAHGQADLLEKVQMLKSRLDHLHHSAGSSGDRITLELRVAEAAKKTPVSELQHLSSQHLKMVEDLVHKYKPLLVDTRSQEEIRRDEQRKKHEAQKAASSSQPA